MMELTVEERLTYLEDGLKAVVSSCGMLLMKIIELSDHTNEHHEVINDLGRIVATLEEMMIGGTPDESEAPSA